MLNMIKNLIKEKQSFQESASLILENDQLDDSIVLGAEVSKTEPEKPAEAPIEQPVENPNEINQIHDDILSTEIDLKSNTLSDTIPVAPATASDAVADDDILNSPIDGTGFDNPNPATPEIAPSATDTDNILDTPIDTPEEVPTTTPAEVPTEQPAEVPASDNILDTPIDDEQKPAEQPEKEEDIFDTPIEEPKQESADPVSAKEVAIVFDKGEQNPTPESIIRTVVPVQGDSPKATEYFNMINDNGTINAMYALPLQNALQQKIYDLAKSKGQDPSDDVITNIKNFAVTPTGIVLKPNGDIGFTFSTNLDPEGIGANLKGGTTDISTGDTKVALECDGIVSAPITEECPVEAFKKKYPDIKEEDLEKLIKGLGGKPITEAISIGDEGTEGGEEAGSEEGSEPNAVTSAIEDKIEDTKEEVPTEDLGGEEPQIQDGNEDLMKRLSSLTKTIEDIKLNLYKNTK